MISNNNNDTMEDEGGLDIDNIAQSIQSTTIPNNSSNNNTNIHNNNNPEEEDEVVKRFEVYLSHKLSDKLYVLQYPLRPKENNYNLNQLKEVRFKPNHKKMEMDFELNTRGEHYNPDNSQEHSTFSLTSNPVPVKSNYAVGILRGNQLHLTPLWNILQLRPSFQHINEGYSTSKSKTVRKKKVGEEDNENGNGQTTATVNKRVMQDRKTLERSYQYLKEQELAEKPISLALYPPQDSIQHIEALFEMRDDPVKFNVPPSAYLKQLVQYREEDLTSMAHGSLGAIKKIKLGERQVYYALYLAKVLPYKKIKELATRVKSDEEMLNALRKYGVFVDGRWAIKSEFNEKIIKLKDLDRNPWTCLKYPKLAAYRDYLLYMFEKQKKVVRSDFVEKTGIEPDKAKQLLEEIAIMKKVNSSEEFTLDDDLMQDEHAAYWILKNERDEAFISEFQSFVHLQVPQMWKKREVEIGTLVDGQFRDLSILLQDHTNMRRTGGSSSKAQPNYVTSVEGELKLFLSKAFRDFGVCSENYLRKLKTEAQSKYIKQAKDEDYHKVLNEMSMEFNESRILKTRSDYTETENKMRVALITALKKNSYKLTKQQAKEHITSLGEDFTNNTFTKVMVELARTDASNIWIAKTGHEMMKK
ncbi:hypothetical protein ABK040_012407 [Willaertia magna]